MAHEETDTELARLKEKVADLATALSLEREVTGNLLKLIEKERSARDRLATRRLKALR